MIRRARWMGARGTSAVYEVPTRRPIPTRRNEQAGQSEWILRPLPDHHDGRPLRQPSAIEPRPLRTLVPEPIRSC
jgi:hypothetical protein